MKKGIIKRSDVHIRLRSNALPVVDKAICDQKATELELTQDHMQN